MTYFESAKHKFQWALICFQEVSDAMDVYDQTNPSKLKIVPGNQSRATTVNVEKPHDVPPEIKLLIGDCIHNFRVSLDYLIWEAVGRVGGNQKRNLYFPIRKLEECFYKACDEIGKHSPQLKEILRSSKAYQWGDGHKLYQLNRLDIADKHKFLPIIVQGLEVKLIKIYNPDGTVNKVLRQPTFANQFGNDMTIAGNMKVEYTTEVESKFLLQIEDDGPEEEIGQLIEEISASVRKQIDNFDAFFSANNL